MSEADEDRLMTGYLLESLGAEERAHVDARMAADATFFERVEAFEDDLILRWHRGHLPAQEREQFERAYAGKARQARIQTSLMLIHTVANVPTASSASRGILGWLRASQQVPRWAIAASLLLLVAIAVSLPPVVRRGDEAVVLAVAFSAVGERGSQPARGYDLVRLPEGVTAVQIQLNVPERTVATRLFVDISANDSDTVRQYTAPEVRWAHGGAFLTLTVPESDLPDGDYVLAVRREASADSDVVLRQAFRVTRTGS